MLTNIAVFSVKGWTSISELLFSYTAHRFPDLGSETGMFVFEIYSVAREDNSHCFNHMIL